MYICLIHIFIFYLYMNFFKMSLYEHLIFKSQKGKQQRYKALFYITCWAYLVKTPILGTSFSPSVHGYVCWCSHLPRAQCLFAFSTLT